MFESGGTFYTKGVGNDLGAASCISGSLCPRFLPSPINTAQEIIRDDVCPLASFEEWTHGL